LAERGGNAPFSWDVTAGALPPGLTLTAGTGEISGTPQTAGTSSFTVRRYRYFGGNGGQIPFDRDRIVAGNHDNLDVG
jgi:hypothetical protein